MPIHGPFSGGIGTGGEGGRSVFVPSASPFADIAARDTWAAANLNELINTPTQVTMIIVTGTPDIVYEWGGEDTPASYNSNGWLDRTGTPSGDEIVALVNATPTHRIVSTAQQQVIDDLQNLPSGSVPVAGSGTLSPSSIAEDQNIVDIAKSCVFLPSDTRFGSTSLRVSGDLFYTTSSRTNRSFFALGTPFTQAGTGSPMSLELTALVEMPETAQQRLVDTTFAMTAGDTHEFITPGGVGVDHLFFSFVSRSSVAGTVQLQLFVGDDATGDQVVNMAYDLTTSDQTFINESFPRILESQNYYTRITAITDVTLLGTGTGAAFRPYQVASGWPYGEVTVATETNITTLLEAKTGDDRLDASAIKNISTGRYHDIVYRNQLIPSGFFASMLDFVYPFNSFNLDTFKALLRLNASLPVATVYIQVVNTSSPSTVYFSGTLTVNSTETDTFDIPRTATTLPTSDTEISVIAGAQSPATNAIFVGFIEGVD